jgi:hypothetical protein
MLWGAWRSMALQRRLMAAFGAGAVALAFACGALLEPAGTPMTADAGVSPDESATVDGSTGGGAGDRLDGDVDAGSPVVCTECPKIVFVTAITFSSAFGTVDVADGRCQEAATKSGLAQMLGKSFIAWISGLDKASTISTPGQRVIVQSKGTYSTPGPESKIIANNWQELASASHVGPIDHDEHGAPVPLAGQADVWTGTWPDGRRSGALHGLGREPGRHRRGKARKLADQRRELVVRRRPLVRGLA